MTGDTGSGQRVTIELADGTDIDGVLGEVRNDGFAIWTEYGREYHTKAELVAIYWADEEVTTFREFVGLVVAHYAQEHTHETVSPVEMTI